MASIKIKRLREQIRQKVATVLVRDISDPRVTMVTVTRVELTRDLSLAKIYWSSLAEDAQRRTIERGLEDSRAWVQREVAQILSTRTTPTLQWCFDESVRGSARMTEIIQDAREEDDRRARDRGETVDEEQPTEDQEFDNGPADDLNAR